MAAGWLHHLAGDTIEVRSAGSQPATELNPMAVAAMAEVGIDLTGNQPAKLTLADTSMADVIVTMGCGDECPYVPGKSYEDWQIPDPAGLSLESIRPIRDEIRDRVEKLIRQLTPES